MNILARIIRICVSSGIICFSVAAFTCSSAWAAEVKRILVLHSFGSEFKPWSEYAKAIRAELHRQSPWPLDLYEYPLVSVRTIDEDSEGPFVAYLDALFAKHPPGLIISIGAPAAAFVQRHRKKIFPITPMLLTVVDQRRVRYSVLAENDAVVAVSIDYLAALENILRVLPETKHVAVVVGNSSIEKYWKKEIGDQAKPLTDRLTFKWYDGLSFEDILKDAAALPPRSAIFWELMIVDAEGVVHEESRAMSRLYAVANAPMFSYTDAFFGREIVGGPHVPVLDAGQRVAEVAVRVLGGEKAGNIKVTPVGMGTPKYDWRELQRWGINEDRLPPGSEVHFRTPTAWERYRWQIVAIAAAVIAQALIILVLLSERRRRLLSEATTRESLTELARVDRLATAGELTASIAHEVTQPLAGMVASANAGLRWLSAAKPDIDKARGAFTHIADAGHRANDVIRSVRAIFKTGGHEKRSVDLNGLISRTLALIGAELQEHAIEVETDLDKRLPPVIGDVTQLQQVLLDLLTNSIDSMSSSGSLRRKLRLRSEVQSDEEVLISIEDTGTGFKPDDGDIIFKALFTTKAEGMGLGLSICRSVIEGHGGRIWASSDGYSGAKFQFALPTVIDRTIMMAPIDRESSDPDRASAASHSQQPRRRA